MITFKEKPDKEKEIFELLHPIVREWFKGKFNKFSLPQLYGIMEVHSRNNILVSAPTGATKCVTPDTSILVSLDNETKLLTGREIIEIAKTEGKLLAKIDKTGRLYNPRDLRSYSLLNNRVCESKALVYFENCSDKLYKIRTQYGREITLSADHPLLVENENAPIWTPVKDIKLGDKIAVPNKIDLPEKEIFLDYQKCINNLRKNYLVVTYEDFEKLKNKTNNFSNFTNLNKEDIYKIKTLLMTSFSKIANRLDMGLTTVYNLFNFNTDFRREDLYRFFSRECKKINFNKNRIIVKNRGNNTFSFTYPTKIDIKLVRWIAFYLAEGLIGDYKLGTFLMVSQKNRKKLLNEFFDNSREIFDIKFKKKNDKDYVFYSTAFCLFLTDLLGIKRGRGRYVPLPNWLLNTTKEIKFNFLNVFFSLEATIPSDGREVILPQSNQNKIEVINYLLLSFGIFGSMTKKINYATNTDKKVKRLYYYLSVRGIKNLKLFLSNINIDHPRRKLLNKQILKKPSGEYISKFKFNYRRILALSKFYENHIEFMKELGTIYEVVRRTGYITENALLSLKFKIEKFSDQSYVKDLIRTIDRIYNGGIYWLEVVSIGEINYRGDVVDLTVPDVHNFIGGYGGIFLHNTLTAFTSILNELIDSDQKGILEDRIYCVYISPLRALSNDIHVNLIEPLKEMEEIAGRKFNIRIAVRTGDTTQAERAKMLKEVPHILITTPESLSIMLSSPKFKEHLRNVDFCIADEVHALAENKRGVHLSLSLEILQKLSPGMTRIGLSATIAPIFEIAKFLVGYENDKERPCKIIDVQFLKQLDLQVLSPVDDLIDVTHGEMHHKMYELIDKLIQQHRTTLIFTNTRSGTERVVHYLKEKFPDRYKDNIGAHHGSLSREHRFNLEKRMREGKLTVISSSTSLELGIDIGYIDLVVLLGSPKSVARCSQRVGRSGHKLHNIIKGRIIVLDRDDLIECSVLLKNVIEHKIDKIHIPTNCLDVLAQQIYGVAIADRIHKNELFNLIRKSYCYRNLSKEDFMDVIDYLSGKFISLEDRHIYAKIWYDEESGIIGKRGKLARVLYMTNIGTIPDETHVKVKVGEQTVGHIDEAFLERLRKGDIFVLGGSVYEFKYSRGMTAQVLASVDRPPTVPSWFSEMLPLSFDLANEIQKFRFLMKQKFESGRDKKEIIEFIHDYLYVDNRAANAIYNYFREQYSYIGIPNEKELFIEHYKGDRNYYVFHSLYGRRVNDVLSRAVAYALLRSQRKDVEIGVNDNGFYLATERKIQLMNAFKLLKSKELRQVMELAINKTEVLKRRFRHCATRALMILRTYKGKQKRVGRQQVSSMILMNAVKRISKDFSILKEARREVLEDLMDIDNSVKVLEDIEKGKLKIKEVNTTVPSPFAFNLVLQGYIDVLKIEDKVEFLKKMHKKVMAKISLR